jgi:ferredoxin
VLKINPQFGRLVSKDEALAYVRRCRDSGLVQVIGRNKLDQIWLGTGPGEKLMTICNCCPCCCLWKALPVMTPRISNKVMRFPGVNVKVTDRCLGCGTCADGVCFVDAIRLEDERARIGPECRGCGRCVEACPNEAIELTLGGNGDIIHVIQRLEGKVRVQ